MGPRRQSHRHVAELNLLYDCDENGEFLHAYTQTFDDRFFFEIVERRDGYQQYGAANAPVRMAAQAQRLVSSRLDGLTCVTLAR